MSVEQTPVTVPKKIAVFCDRQAFACGPRRKLAPKNLSDRRRIALGDSCLVPVGINAWRRTRGIKTRQLGGSELPAEGAQILPELFLVPRSNDYVGDGGSLQQPVDRNLRYGLAGFP